MTKVNQNAIDAANSIAVRVANIERDSKYIREVASKYSDDRDFKKRLIEQGVFSEVEALTEGDR